ALRCNLNGRRALLTAVHVLEEAKTEPHGIALSAGYGERPYVVAGPLHIDPIADLAVYFLPDDYPCADAAFWPSARIDRSPDGLATDYLFLHGFPGESGQSARPREGVVSKSLPYGAMQRLEDLPPDLQPFQFAIEYDPVGMTAETGASRELVD